VGYGKWAENAGLQKKGGIVRKRTGCPETKRKGRKEKGRPTFPRPGWGNKALEVPRSSYENGEEERAESTRGPLNVKKRKCLTSGELDTLEKGGTRTRGATEEGNMPHGWQGKKWKERHPRMQGGGATATEERKKPEPTMADGVNTQGHLWRGGGQKRHRNQAV